MTETGLPCRLCQVRPDVACRHRPADPNWSLGEIAPARDPKTEHGGGGQYRKPRFTRPGNGNNFRRTKS